MHRFSDASYRVIKLMNPRETALRKVLDGQGAKTDVPAYELETSVIIWNKPGDNAAFPSFVTAISCHNPGELTGHAAELMRRQKDLGFNRFELDDEKTSWDDLSQSPVQKGHQKTPDLDRSLFPQFLNSSACHKAGRFVVRRLRNRREDGCESIPANETGLRRHFDPSQSCFNR